MHLQEKLKLFDYSKHIASIRVHADRAFFINLADIHAGLNNRKLFQAIIQFILSIPNCFVVIGGDSTNHASKISKGDPKEERVSGDQQLFELATDLRPLVEAERLVAIIQGNHGSGRYKETIGHSPEETLAHLLGHPELYKAEFAIVYVTVRENCYVHFVHHSGNKPDKFAHISADVVWREHSHDYRIEERLVMEHNKYIKRPIVKNTFEIWSGSYQILPNYTKVAGFRPVLPGSFFVEMSGVNKRWGMLAWKDHHLAHAIAHGYTTV